MDKPALIIMAAGMGSRFGGLKQIEPVDDEGHIIMDFSLYDAYQAGFRKVVFVITREIEESFLDILDKKIAERFELHYVFQRLDDVPEGCAVPPERVKPWGTAHAARSCRDVINGPFAIINADDFYGPTAFSAIYDYLAAPRDEREHAMVAYKLRNTVTENGCVARGVCSEEGGFLSGIVERTHIEKRGGDAAYTEDGATFLPLSGETPVSMNMWGFHRGMMDAFVSRFPAFLERDVPQNPARAEYFLPSVVNAEMCEGLARVRVLPCEEVWYGVTYREDLPGVRAALARMKSEGVYPEKLW